MRQNPDAPEWIRGRDRGLQVLNTNCQVIMLEKQHQYY